MAVKKKPKKALTKAQRSAAAKASWARRRAEQELVLPAETPASAPTEPAIRYVPEPHIVYAVREGYDVFVCFARAGSLNRERLNTELARKLLRELTAILV